MTSNKQAQLFLRLLIRESILLEEEEILVGDIKKAKQALVKYKTKEAGLEALKSVGKATAGTLAGLMGLGGYSSFIDAGINIADTIQAAKGKVKPEDKKKNPMWDLLTLDEPTAAILDNSVEDKFIQDFSKGVEALPDDAKVPNADTQLNNWLKAKYNGRRVEKPE